jgi:hypothetical protein
LWKDQKFKAGETHMKKPTTIPRMIAGLVLLTALTAPAFAGSFTGCPVITGENRPALLFVEGPIDQSHLYVAYRKGRDLHREELISGRHLEVSQLDNAVFLISVTNAPADRKVYAANLAAGRTRLLAEGTWLNCLRAEPRNKAAILLTRDPKQDLARFVELDLAALQATPRYVFSREELGEDFDNIDSNVRISPDFGCVAYVRKKTPARVERWSEYELRLLDLPTMKTRILDPNVGVEISIASSFAWGRPVFEWLSEKEILYRDMPPGGSDKVADFASERLSLFKIVNIDTGLISEAFRKRLSLTLDGGSLKTDPVSGALVYNEEFVLDLPNEMLTPKNLPFAVVRDYSARRTDILCGQRLLYSGPANCVNTCVSASGRNFAYALRERTESLDARLNAKFSASDQPVRVAEGPYLPTRAVAWIE